MEHADLWIAIDRFAQQQGVTCSGLARRCGLDATVLNKSKRVSHFGQPRWVSVGTLAKILNGTGTTIHDFVKLIPKHQ